MITEIDEILKDWAEWQNTTSGRGGSKSTTMVYGPHGSYGKGLVVVRNPVAELIDTIICEMPKRKQRLHLIAKYVWGMNAYEAGETLGVGRTSHKEIVNGGHEWLDGYTRGLTGRPPSLKFLADWLKCRGCQPDLQKPSRETRRVFL